MAGKSFSESPFIKILLEEASDAFPSSSAQLVHQAEESREGLVAHYP